MSQLALGATLGTSKACLWQAVAGWGWADGRVPLACPASRSAVPREEVLEGAVIVLVEGRVDEGVEEGVGVAEPQEDALPGGRDVAGAQGAEELGGEEWDPAEREHPDEDAHHEGGALLLLLAPRIPVGLEGDRGAARGEDHLRPLSGALHLEKANASIRRATPSHTRGGLTGDSGGPTGDSGGPGFPHVHFKRKLLIVHCRDPTVRSPHSRANRAECLLTF